MQKPNLYLRRRRERVKCIMFTHALTEWKFNKPRVFDEIFYVLHCIQWILLLYFYSIRIPSPSVCAFCVRNMSANNHQKAFANTYTVWEWFRILSHALPWAVGNYERRTNTLIDAIHVRNDSEMEQVEWRLCKIRDLRISIKYLALNVNFINH